MVEVAHTHACLQEEEEDGSIEESGLGTEAKPSWISLHLGTIWSGKVIFGSTEQHFTIYALHSVPTCSVLQ